jgi:hypothetical protein
MQINSEKEKVKKGWKNKINEGKGLKMKREME